MCHRSGPLTEINCLPSRTISAEKPKPSLLRVLMLHFAHNSREGIKTT
jgi:hypothetical protein